MGLIEQAARRLEELRRAGIEVPEARERPVAAAAPAPVPTPAPAAAPAPERAPGAQARSTRLNIDLAALAAAGFVTPDVPTSRIADEFRILKRPLIANASGKGAAPVRNGNLIVVTSSVPGEGKSFTSVNLAMSIAMEMDRTVLLVDADVARPTLPKTLGLKETPGLLDVL